jgi:hypothetical protein
MLASVGVAAGAVSSDLPHPEPAVAPRALHHERTRGETGRHLDAQGTEVRIDANVAAPSERAGPMQHLFRSEHAHDVRVCAHPHASVGDRT